MSTASIRAQARTATNGTCSLKTLAIRWFRAGCSTGRSRIRAGRPDAASTWSPMGEIGDLFTSGELFVPEMLLAARAMKAGLAVLKPSLMKTQAKPKGTIVLATVFGDLHDIGKNLVGMMLEGAGFKVIDLGVNTKAETIIETALEVKADVIGLSALLTTTMPFMKQTIEAIEEAGLVIPVIIGGAPVSPDFANNVGASGYGDNAPIAVEICKKCIAAGKPGSTTD